MDSKTFDFKDINLVPKKCIVNSRSECDTSVILGKYKFKLPIVPSNMECVISEELAEELAQNGYFYILHRFGVNVILFLQTMKMRGLFTSISIGVNEDSYELLNDIIIYKVIPDYITIDIAHGHSIKMEKMIKFIRRIPELKDVFLICGNVSTPDAVTDLIEWGADCIKTGIGNGRVCTTYPNTGYGSRDIQAYCVQKCVEVAGTIPVIADGGIIEIGEIAKSLALGASMVMIGGMLSGFMESPGKIIQSPDGKMYKEYYGSASEHSLGSDGSKKNKHIEGTHKLIPYKSESIFTYLEHVKQSLQSAISYGGGKDLKCFKDVRYIIKK
jgi:GMP reductase